MDQIFEEPPFLEWQKILFSNQNVTHIIAEKIGTQNFKNFRSELLSLARSYTHEIHQLVKEELGGECEIQEANDVDAIIGSGHQPVIYHPGLAQKVKRLCEVSQNNKATGINFIIDTDSGNIELKAPIGNGAALHIGEFVVSEGPELFATAKIASEEKISQAFSWMSELEESHPLSGKKDVLETLKRSYQKLSGKDLTKSQSAIRRLFLKGCYLELPLTYLCKSKSFWHVFSLILGDIWKLPDIYNQALKEFRVERAIKNEANPFPDLKIDTDKGSKELPFWLIDFSAATRRIVSLRRREKIFEWTTDEGTIAQTHSAEVSEFLQKLGENKIVAPRGALVSLAFRALCCEMFIHGRGGAHYDPFTDKLSEKLFSALPRFVVSSATWTLYPREAAIYRAAVEARQNYKEMVSQPEAYFGKELFSADTEEKLALLAAKRVKLISELQKSDSDAKQSLNRALSDVRREIRSVIDSGDFTERTKIVDSPDQVVKAWTSREFPVYFFS